MVCAGSNVCCVQSSVCVELWLAAKAARLCALDLCIYMYMYIIYVCIYVWQFHIGMIESKYVMGSCPDFSRSVASEAHGKGP